MPRPCTICLHRKCKYIDADLRNGEGVRVVASRFRVNKDALQRHKTHLNKVLGDNTDTPIAKRYDTPAIPIQQEEPVSVYTPEPTTDEGVQPIVLFRGEPMPLGEMVRQTGMIGRELITQVQDEIFADFKHLWKRAEASPQLQQKMAAWVSDQLSGEKEWVP